MAVRQRQNLSIPPGSDERVIAKEEEDVEDDELPALKEQEDDDDDEYPVDFDRDESSDCSDLPALCASSDDEDEDEDDDTDESDDISAPTTQVPGNIVKTEGLKRGFFQAKVKQVKQTTRQTRENTLKTSSIIKTEQTSGSAPGVIPSTKTHLSQGTTNVTGGSGGANLHVNDDIHSESDGDANDEGGESQATWFQRYERARLAEERKKRLESKKARQRRKKESQAQEIEVAEELAQLRKLERLKELEELRKSGILPPLSKEEEGKEDHVIGRCRNGDKNKCPNSSQQIVYTVVDAKKKEKEIAAVPSKQKEKRHKFVSKEEEVKKAQLKNNVAVDDSISQSLRKASKTFKYCHQPKGQQDESNLQLGQSSITEKVSEKVLEKDPKKVAEKVSEKMSEKITNQQESTSDATTSESVKPGSQTIQTDQVVETLAVVKKSPLPIENDAPLRLVIKDEEEELVVGNKTKKVKNKKVSKQGKARASSIFLSGFMMPETTHVWGTERSGRPRSTKRQSISTLANISGSQYSGQAEDDNKTEFPPLASKETSAHQPSPVEDKSLVALLGDLIVPPTELLSCKPLHLLVENVDSTIDDLELVERFTNGGACVEDIRRFWDQEIAVVTFSRFEEALTAQVLNRSYSGSSGRLHCSHLLRQQPSEDPAGNFFPLTASSNTVTLNPSVTANPFTSDHSIASNLSLTSNPSLASNPSIPSNPPITSNPSVFSNVSGESSQSLINTSQIHEDSGFIVNLPAAPTSKQKALPVFSLQPSAPAFFPSTLTDKKSTTLSSNSILLEKKKHEQVERPLQSFPSQFPSKSLSGKTTTANQLKADAEEFVLPKNNPVRTAEQVQFPPQLDALNVSLTGKTPGNMMLNIQERGDKSLGRTGEMMTWQQMDLYQGDWNVALPGITGGLFIPGHQPLVTGPSGGTNDGMTWQQMDLMCNPKKLSYSFGQIIAATEEEIERYRQSPPFWLNPKELVCPHQISPRQSALFMFDPESGRIHGIYESITHGLDHLSLIQGGGQLVPVCFQVVIDYPVLHERQLGLVITAGHFEDHDWDLPLYLTGEQVEDLMDLFEQLSTSDNENTGANLKGSFLPNVNHSREQLVPEFVGHSCTNAPGLSKKSCQNSSSLSLSLSTCSEVSPSGSSVPERIYETGESSGGAYSPHVNTKNSTELAESQHKQIPFSSKPLEVDKSSKDFSLKNARDKSPVARKSEERSFVSVTKEFAGFEVGGNSSSDKEWCVVPARRHGKLAHTISGDKGAIASGLQQILSDVDLEMDLDSNIKHAESFDAKAFGQQRLDGIEKVDSNKNDIVFPYSSGSKALQSNNQIGENIENGLAYAQKEEICTHQGVTKHLKEITRSNDKNKQPILSSPPGFLSRPSSADSTGSMEAQAPKSVETQKHVEAEKQVETSGLDIPKGTIKISPGFVSSENLFVPEATELGHFSCENVSVTSGPSPNVRGAFDRNSLDNPKQGNVGNSTGNFDQPVSNHVSTPTSSATLSLEQQEADILSKFRHLLPLPIVPPPGHCKPLTTGQDSLPPDGTSGQKKQGTRSTTTGMIMSSTSNILSTTPPCSYNPLGLKEIQTTSSSSIVQENPHGSLNIAVSIPHNMQKWPSVSGTYSVPSSKREEVGTSGTSGTRSSSRDGNFPWVYKVESKRFHRVRSGPNIHFEDLGVLRPGALVVVEEQDGDWLRLVIPGHSQCWSLSKDGKADIVFLKPVPKKMEFLPIINSTIIEDLEKAQYSTPGTHGISLQETSTRGHQEVSSQSTLSSLPPFPLPPHQGDNPPILSVTRNSHGTELVTGSAKRKGKKKSPSSQTQSNTSTSAPVLNQTRESKKETDSGLVADNSSTADSVLRSIMKSLSGPGPPRPSVGGSTVGGINGAQTSYLGALGVSSSFSSSSTTPTFVSSSSQERNLPRQSDQTGVSRGKSSVQSSTLGSSHLCTFCLKSPASYLILDCAHYGPCEDCRNSLSLTHCKVCSKKVKSMKHFKWS